MTEQLPELRRPDWPERLADFIEERRLMAFGWGVNDCCLFAADAMHRMTDVDVAAHLRGQYATAIEAARVLADEGGVLGLVRAVLGEPLANAAQAGRGDVVCVSLDGRDTLGVVAGNGYWVAPGDAGLVFRPMAEVRLAWKV